MSLTSVLLPVYNGERYLESAMASVLAQDAELELLVQDDCSTDRSAEMARAFKDPRVRYAGNDRNGGCWATLQAAADRARGDLLRLFSHDDLMLKDDVAGAERYLRDNPSFSVAISDYEMIDSDGATTGSSQEYLDLARELPDRINGAESAWLLFRHGCVAGTQSTITVRRDLVEKLGGFDTWMKYCGDFMFLAKAAIAGGLVYRRQITSKIRFHAAQTSKQGRKRLEYLDEMHAIMSELYAGMDDAHRKRATREFKWIYGRQFVDAAVKELLRGNGALLARLEDQYGWAGLGGASIAWCVSLPARAIARAHRGRG